MIIGGPKLGTTQWHLKDLKYWKDWLWPYYCHLPSHLLWNHTPKILICTTISEMSHTIILATIPFSGPLNNITSQWDHRELHTALYTAINCQEVPGPLVPQNIFNPTYITLPLGSSVVNGIALHMKKKSSPGVFENRMVCLVKYETGGPVGDFQRALDYHNLWVSYYIPTITLPNILQQPATPFWLDGEDQVRSLMQCLQTWIACYDI